MTVPPLPSCALVIADVSGANHSGLSEEANELIRVLVVDDDARVRAAISETIALEVDMEMAADASDAHAARAGAERTAPAVALVDVLLPDEKTGLELVRHLSQRPGCGVVAMSVRSGLRHAALAAGAVAFVEKSSDIDAVLAAIRSAASESARRP